jgi:alanine racemase
MPLAPRQWGGRPVWAEIDLDAVAHNVKLLAARARPARVLAVVKANAYGHGAIAVARAALAAGADALAVVCVDEAEELRRAGIAAPVLVMGHTPATDAPRVVELGLEPGVGGPELVEALSALAAARGKAVPIHLELETGFGRHGLTPDAAVELAERARAMPGIEVKALFTHFATADEEDLEFTQGQFEVLEAAAQRLPWVPERHCSASAAVLRQLRGRGPAGAPMSLSAVRVGISLYGYAPAPGCGTPAELRPALALKSRVVRVADLAAGGSVGYGRTFVARRPSRIALVMAGYADGYRRSLGNQAQALVRGRRVPVVGRVSMDMTTLDVTDVPGVVPGDVATLLGADGAERIDADELARLTGTISYEVLAAISARVPRLYLRGGEVVETSTLNERTPRPA